MIDLLRQYSSSLTYLKPVVLVFITASVLFIAYTMGMLVKDVKNDYLMPSLVLFIWSLNLYIMLLVFPSVPSIPSKEASFSERLKIRVKRFAYHLLSIIFLIASLGAFYVGFILLRIWILG